MANFIISRGISTSCARYGKRNFRKFPLINKRGSKLFKKMQTENPDPLYPIDRELKICYYLIFNLLSTRKDKNQFTFNLFYYLSINKLTFRSWSETSGIKRS